MKKNLKLIVIATLLCLGAKAENSAGLKLWFDRPAGQWEETVPLGNGRLGMMPDGGIEKETLVLNDITLW